MEIIREIGNIETDLAYCVREMSGYKAHHNPGNKPDVLIVGLESRPKDYIALSLGSSFVAILDSNTTIRAIEPPLDYHVRSIPTLPEVYRKNRGDVGLMVASISSLALDSKMPELASLESAIKPPKGYNPFLDQGQKQHRPPRNLGPKPNTRQRLPIYLKR